MASIPLLRLQSNGGSADSGLSTRRKGPRAIGPEVPVDKKTTNPLSCKISEFRSQTTTGSLSATPTNSVSLLVLFGLQYRYSWMDSTYSMFSKESLLLSDRSKGKQSISGC